MRPDTFRRIRVCFFDVDISFHGFFLKWSRSLVNFVFQKRS